MYCKECLGTIHEGEQFCTSCGSPVDGYESKEEVVEEEVKVVQDNKVKTTINKSVSNLKSDNKLENRSEEVETQIAQVLDKEVKTPRILIDPKTGKSVLPDDMVVKELKEVNEVPPIESVHNNHDEATSDRIGSGQNNNSIVNSNEDTGLKSSEPRNSSQYKRVGTKVYGSQPKPQLNVKKDKTIDYVVGIMGVVLSFISSLIGGIFFFGLITMMITSYEVETQNIDTISNSIMALLGLKGFVFATLGLIGVLNIKKNSTVAAIFFLSAAIGSIFSFQFIRFGLFLGAAIVSFNHKEKTEKPMMNYMIKAFIPTVIIIILLVLSFIGFAVSDLDDTEDYDTVQKIRIERSLL